jgi:peptidoglycan hydrolase-like protein with peptidoglycan-binding domain
MVLHADARAQAAVGYWLHFGREVTLPELQILCGIGWLETRYGSAWPQGRGAGSNNMGAVQATAAWTGETFTSKDTHPQPDGSSIPYIVKFKVYPTPEEGWADVAKIAFKTAPANVLLAAQKGDIYSVSRGMYYNGYYEGFGKNAKERIQHHYEALYKGIVLANQTLGQPMPDGGPTPPPPPPTLKVGSLGDSVKLWQKILGVPQDGIFGPATEARTKQFQIAHNLPPDGIVGPLTWAAAKIGTP